MDSTSLPTSHNLSSLKLPTSIPTSTQTPVPTTIDSKVTYKDFNVGRMTCTAPESKTVPNTGPNANPPSAEQKYFVIPVMYKYGPEGTKTDEMLIEGPELRTESGIIGKTAPNSSRLEYSLMTRFDVNIPEQVQFLETLKALHGGCAQILAAYKGAVKFYNFDPKMAEATGMKPLIYQQRDEASGEIIAGRAPSIFLKLLNRGKPPLVDQTLFTDLEGNPIDWKLLTNVEMKYIPLINVKRIYVGQKASIQLELRSAIVTDIHARNTTSKQLDTIHELRAKDGELSNKVTSQLSKLLMERQDQFLGSSKAPSSAPADNASGPNQPTFSGITPTKPNAAPPIPSMSDFTGNAPPRMVMN